MKNGTKKIIACFLVLTIAGVALDAFFFLKIERNIEAMYSAKTIVDAETASFQQNRILEQLAVSIQPEMASLNSRVIGSNGAASFIETVESLGRTSGLTVTISSVSNTPTAAGPGGSYQLLNITVATEGSWAETSHFLSLLQTLPYKVDLSSTNLVENSKTGGSWSGQFTINALQEM